MAKKQQASRGTRTRRTAASTTSGGGRGSTRGGRGTGKIAKVMGEYKRRSLRSSSGAKVRKRKQAVAIALSEARQSGARIPKKRRKARA